MSEKNLDALLQMQSELNGRLTGLSIAVAHLFAIEAQQNPEGAADRALGDVEGTVSGIGRQLPDGPEELRAAVIAQLRSCLAMAGDQLERAKRQAPTSTGLN